VFIPVFCANAAGATVPNNDIAAIKAVVRVVIIVKLKEKLSFL
jgi:hypothetical protein